jgi:hypothetical protein
MLCSLTLPFGGCCRDLWLAGARGEKPISNRSLQLLLAGTACLSGLPRSYRTAYPGGWGVRVLSPRRKTRRRA